MQPQPAQAGLFLAVHPQAIAGGALHQMAAVMGERQGRLGGEAGVAGQHRLSIGLQAQGLDQIHQAALGADGPVALLLEVAQQRQGEQGQLLTGEPEAQGDGQLIALGGEEAAHHHGETQLAVVVGGQEGQIVMQQEAVGGTADGHVELAGQIAGAIGRQQAVLNCLHQGAGVEEFLRIDAGQGICGDVAGVVVAGLAAGETHPLQAGEQRCHVFQQQTAQLDVLTGGEVGAALVATAIDAVGQQLQLLRLDHAAGQPQPHHEATRGDRAKEDPQPLEMDGEGRLIQALPAVSGQLGQARSQIQTAELGLGLLNLAQFCRRLHGDTQKPGSARLGNSSWIPYQPGSCNFCYQLPAMAPFSCRLAAG